MADEKNDETKEDNTNGTEEERKLTPAEERSEYFKKLEKWLQEAYAWQSVAAMFPYYVMSSQVLNPGAGITPLPTQIPPVSNTPRLIISITDQQNDPLAQRRPQEPAGQFQQPGAEGFEYRIPPIWKRCAAEFIDSTMLFLLKFSITFIVIDVLDFIDIEDLVDLLQRKLLTDYKMALEISYGILVLQVIHLVIDCIFDTFWLQHGMNGLIGGATPGKSMMGLRVVHCRSITPVERPGESDLVLVTPGTDLGLPLALGRSVVKNLILAFLFPISFALFFFRFNRTGYDLICNSIVVEDPYRDINNNRLHQQ